MLRYEKSYIIFGMKPCRASGFSDGFHASAILLPANLSSRCCQAATDSGAVLLLLQSAAGRALKDFKAERDSLLGKTS